MTPATTTSFTDRPAPCGQRVDGQIHHDQDEDGLIIDDYFFACGCRSIHHEFHDGSLSQRIVHHNGHVILDELIAEH